MGGVGGGKCVGEGSSGEVACRVRDGAIEEGGGGAGVGQSLRTAVLKISALADPGTCREKLGAPRRLLQTGIERAERAGRVTISPPG